jgi:hypothetical protein
MSIPEAAQKRPTIEIGSLKILEITFGEYFVYSCFGTLSLQCCSSYKLILSAPCLCIWNGTGLKCDATSALTKMQRKSACSNI